MISVFHPVCLLAVVAVVYINSQQDVIDDKRLCQMCALTSQEHNLHKQVPVWFIILTTSVGGDA